MSLWHPDKTKLLNFERYYDGSLAAGASFTPVHKGLFMASGLDGNDFSIDRVHWEVYSTANAKWGDVAAYQYSVNLAFHLAIGDGANLRLKNACTAAINVVIFRMGY